MLVAVIRREQTPIILVAQVRHRRAAKSDPLGAQLHAPIGLQAFDERFFRQGQTVLPWVHVALDVQIGPRSGLHGRGQGRQQRPGCLADLGFARRETHGVGRDRAVGESRFHQAGGGIQELGQQAGQHVPVQQPQAELRVGQVPMDRQIDIDLAVAAFQQGDGQIHQPGAGLIHALPQGQLVQHYPVFRLDLALFDLVTQVHVQFALFDPIPAELARVGRKRGQIQPLERHPQVGMITVVHGFDLAEHPHGQVAVEPSFQNPGCQRVDTGVESADRAIEFPDIGRETGLHAAVRKVDDPVLDPQQADGRRGQAIDRGCLDLQGLQFLGDGGLAGRLQCRQKVQPAFLIHRDPRIGPLRRQDAGHAFNPCPAFQQRFDKRRQLGPCITHFLDRARVPDLAHQGSDGMTLGMQKRGG